MMVQPCCVPTLILRCGTAASFLVAEATSGRVSVLRREAQQHRQGSPLGAAP